jgi:hypothetical protein
MAARINKRKWRDVGAKLTEALDWIEATNPWNDENED